MIRRGLAAAFVMLMVGGIVLAGTYTGLVTKIDKDGVTILVKKDKKDKNPEEKKFKVKDIKEVKFGTKVKKDVKDATLDDVTKAIEESKGKVKGVAATIETEGEGDKETVTKVTYSVGKKK